MNEMIDYTAKVPSHVMVGLTKRWSITYYINGNRYTGIAYGDNAKQAVASLIDDIGIIHATFSVANVRELP